jgi:cysteine desulfurase
MAGQTIYLDHAAATPVDPAVLAAMQPFYADKFYNPSATYLAAKEVKKALETARAGVAHWLGARPAEIIFTAGGTEANNLAIHGIMRRFPDGNIVVGGIEHDSVLAPAKRYDFRAVKVQADGRLDLEDLAKKIDEKTVLVSVMYANNEVGTIQPIKQAAKIINDKKRSRKTKLPLYFHTDACQATNYLDLHVSRLGVDMMTINGGKIYGPKQSGALYIKGGIELQPLVDGGGQERGLRSGTENVAGSVGLAKALDIAQAMRREESTRLKKLQDEFFKLIEEKLPDAIINGSRRWRLPNNLHITLPGQDNERLLIQLEEKGLLAAAGSACSASDEEPSHVLRAMGVSDALCRASLRLTMGRQTTSAMVKSTIEKLTAPTSS